MFDFGCYQLFDWFYEFMMLYLGVMFLLMVFDLLLNLWQDEIDFVICFVVLFDGVLIVCWFVINWCVLCVVLLFVECYGVLVDLYDLVCFLCNVIMIVFGLMNIWYFMCGDEVQIYMVFVLMVFEINDGGFMCEWMLCGYGIVLKLLWDIVDDVCVGWLCVLLFEWWYQDVLLYVIYYSKCYMVLCVCVLFDFFVECFVCEEVVFDDLLNVCC